MLGEIRAVQRRPRHRLIRLRLWISLLDPRQVPAIEPVQLYVRRWEQELFFGQLKHQLRKDDTLQSRALERRGEGAADWKPGGPAGWKACVTLAPKPSAGAGLIRAVRPVVATR